MPLLTEFRGKFKGGTRQNRFEITASSDTGNMDTIKYFATALSIPAQIVDEIPVDFQGRRVYIPGDKDNPQWTLTILDDTDGKIWETFQKWNAKIANPGENTADYGPAAKRQNWTVDHLDTNNKKLKTINLAGCWPTQIGAIQLSNSQRNTLVTFDVTIRYDYWTAGPVTAGSTETLSSTSAAGTPGSNQAGPPAP